MAEFESPAPTADSQNVLADDFRQLLLSNPELILADRDLMRALIGAHEEEVGGNVIDIRGRAMAALEDRLERLEVTHETVISTAYENQSGMNTIHRAVLALLEPADFPAFLDSLQTTIAPILRIDTLRLVFETSSAAEAPTQAALQVLPAGMIGRLLQAGGRPVRRDVITLRAALPATAAIHGKTESPILSEALMPIDLGLGRWPALLVMGSTEATRFMPSHGTDLLRFFTQAFQRVLIGWLRE